ncbi:hypothetical protein [Roseomonas populi]|uniref:Uncharacterized protein n=1 Tax=Roseomonas populi TaxID=3121582 RepID=A0ABT1X156_9PROT|nr:hypothetical protein [Roseomonas pecuniae]MCR0981837.1 hypothetical protein [Roseomonas pecuniae]
MDEPMNESESDNTPGSPAPTPRPAPSERERRLAAALRENLKRRKAQSRERAQPSSPPEEQE